MVELEMLTDTSLGPSRIGEWHRVRNRVSGPLEGGNILFSALFACALVFFRFRLFGFGRPNVIDDDCK